ncbi:DUF2891 domain-containing protein [Pseudidiomarina sp. 1APP75-32.1]|uniref:DUF2891 domain-containing protein n=1 Tax=Pseudidiomarina terrestris TaxID=2820060 RepID=A0AAW7R2E6_9GAMM|nr:MULTISPECIES: DUF2891 domain-containing protein [unclassified Pseudidiomarina]MDN7125483.1 DUF2891 domain-containing protein [Pseudidiomarina sp. 1APP75-32.1]MDN7130241.1 DUF2891 domain-containing protein [Pseudidiomarina sp. 1APR75-15]MDN7137213.1 DUF2891 domain-containing protein [Pseudidiomarina sp. 1ASP75-14]
MNKYAVISTAILLSCGWFGQAQAATDTTHRLTQAEADKLVALPLHCVETPYPYKTGFVLGGAEDVKEPREHHPVFYGCFDWHSAVHGYWSLVTLLRQFPDMEHADEARAILKRNLTAENVAHEAEFFSKEIHKSFERTYGWAWLLKLSDELHAWQDPLGQELAKNLQPLADVIVDRYQSFLPQLLYPVRVGEHSNTAFGLSFAYDYAVNQNLTDLQELIRQRAKAYFIDDKNCPISWEPSGYDFISPCLEEIGLMQRVLSKEEFLPWLADFMPQLADEDYSLEVGRVSDRTDGKLVHLDGLNFSRAWNLYALANEYPQYSHLRDVADAHFAYSYPNLIGDSYEGGHWLGSFAIQALNQAQHRKDSK